MFILLCPHFCRSSLTKGLRTRMSSPQTSLLRVFLARMFLARNYLSESSYHNFLTRILLTRIFLPEFSYQNFSYLNFLIRISLSEFSYSDFLIRIFLLGFSYQNFPTRIFFLLESFYQDLCTRIRIPPGSFVLILVVGFVKHRNLPYCLQDLPPNSVFTLNPRTVSCSRYCRL